VEERALEDTLRPMTAEQAAEMNCPEKRVRVPSTLCWHAAVA